MLKINTTIPNGDDVSPKKTQFSHIAASALSIIIAEFPQYGFYDDFSKKDQLKCIEWANQHKNNYKTIDRGWKYFYENTILGLH